MPGGFVPPKRKIKRKKPASQRNTVARGVYREAKRREMLPPKRPKAAPYSMVDRLDHKTQKARPNVRGRTPEKRKQTVRRLDRQTARYRTDRDLRRSLRRMRLDRLEKKSGLLDDVLRIARSDINPTRRYPSSRDKDTKIGAFNLEAELEGRGLALKGAEKLKKLIDKGGIRAPGVPVLGTALASDDNLPTTELAKRLGKDAVDIGASAVPSLYGLSAAAAESAQGRHGRAKELGKQIKETDPLYRAVVHGDLEPAKEHPLIFGLELSGAGKAISRGTGGVMRTGGKAAMGAKTPKVKRAGRKVYRAASTARKAKKTPGSNVEQRQSYSTGIVGKQALQKGVNVRVKGRNVGWGERHGAAKYRAEQQKAKRAAAENRPGDAAAHKEKAVKAHPFIASDTYVAKRVDAHEDAGNVIYRLHGAEIDQAARGPRLKRTRLSGGGKGLTHNQHPTLTMLLSENILRPDRADIKAYIGEVQTHIDSGQLSPARKAAAQQIAADLRKALDDKKLDLGAAERQARSYAEKANELQEGLIARDIVDRSVSDTARYLSEPARRHGVRLDEKPTKTPAYIRELERTVEERQAKQVVRRTENQKRTAEKHAARKEGEVAWRTKERDRQLLRQSGPYLDARQELSQAAREVSAAGKAARNGKPGAGQRLRDAQEKAKHARRTLQLVEKELFERGEKAAGQVAASRRRGSVEVRGRTVTRKPEPNEAVQTAARINREPVGGLRTLERLQGRAAELENQLGRARAKADEATKARKDARVPKGERRQRQYRLPDGRVVTLTELRAMASDGGKVAPIRERREPGFVGQDPKGGSPRDYFISGDRPQGIGGARRSGAAAATAARPGGIEAAIGSLRRSQGLIDAFDDYARFLGEVAKKTGRGSLRDPLSKREADNYIRDLAAKPPGRTPGEETTQWMAVPSRDTFGRRAQSRNTLIKAEKEMHSPEEFDATLIREALSGEEFSGDYVLVPRAAARRKLAHSRQLAPSGGARVARTVTTQFSPVVLTTAALDTWMLGNATEGVGRTLLRSGGMSAHDLRFAHAVLNEMKRTDPAHWEVVRARIGTGHFGLQSLRSFRTLKEHLDPNSKLGSLVGKASWLRKQKWGPYEVAEGWKLWTDFVFSKNGAMERQFRTTMYGTALRKQAPKRIPFTKRDAQAWDRAVKAAARGQRDMNALAHSADFVRRGYGRYEAWSPEMRFAINYFTPFVAWTINAGYFLLRTLPQDHPYFTAILATTANAEREYLEARGLLPGRDNSAFPFMLGGAPYGKDRVVALSRTTPFGLISSDPVGQLGSAFVPQFKGAILAALGLDWKGDPLEGTKGSDASQGQKALAVLAALSGSFAPLFSAGQQVKKKGLAETLTPIKTYEVDPERNAAARRNAEIQEKLDALRKKKHPANGKPINAENATPEYRRLLDEANALRKKTGAKRGGRKPESFDGWLNEEGSGEQPSKPKPGGTGETFEEWLNE